VCARGVGIHYMELKATLTLGHAVAIVSLRIHYMELKVVRSLCHPVLLPQPGNPLHGVERIYMPLDFECSCPRIHYMELKEAS